MKKPKKGHPKGVSSPGSGRTPLRENAERITVTVGGEVLKKIDRDASAARISRAEQVRKVLEGAYGIDPA